MSGLVDTLEKGARLRGRIESGCLRMSERVVDWLVEVPGPDNVTLEEVGVHEVSWTPGIKDAVVLTCVKVEELNVARQALVGALVDRVCSYARPPA